MATTNELPLVFTQATLSEAEFERALEGLLDSVGAKDNRLLYVSVPITGGIREARLITRLNCSRLELNRVYADQKLNEVILPNAAKAARYASRLRKLFPSLVVINPADLTIPGWSQARYMRLWFTAIRKSVAAMAVAPGWALSSGARLEVNMALTLGLPIFDVNGQVLEVGDLRRHHLAARAKLKNMGWSTRQISNYLVSVKFVKQPSVPLEARN